MNWLLATAAALAIAVWGARRVRVRGEWPHDPEYDTDGPPPPTLLDGWHGREAS